MDVLETSIHETSTLVVWLGAKFHSEGSSTAEAISSKDEVFSLI